MSYEKRVKKFETYFKKMMKDEQLTVGDSDFDQVTMFLAYASARFGGQLTNIKEMYVSLPEDQVQAKELGDSIDRIIDTGAGHALEVTEEEESGNMWCPLGFSFVKEK